jgi:SAM-dependent methyltransferase
MMTMTKVSESESCLWRTHASRLDRMLDPFDICLFSAGTFRSGDRVLDVGCGAGATTIEAGSFVGAAGHAVGVDLDAGLIKLARQRATGIDNVDFICADAAAHGFAADLDVVISRFGMMLFVDQDAAFAHIAGALRSGGRIAYTTWTQPEANDWFAIPYRAMGVDVPHNGRSFQLANPAVNDALLTRSGFVDVRVEPIDASVWLGSDVPDVLGFLRQHLASALPNPASTDRVLAAARRLLEPQVGEDGVRVGATALLCTGTLGESVR